MLCDIIFLLLSFSIFSKSNFPGLALMKVKFDDVSDEFAGVIKALNALISTNNDYDDLHSMTMLDDSAPFRL